MMTYLIIVPFLFKAPASVGAFPFVEPPNSNNCMVPYKQSQAKPTKKGRLKPISDGLLHVPASLKPR